MNNLHKQTLIELAISEDEGSGDHTSLACIPKEATNKAELRIKANGILAGIDVAKTIFIKLMPDSQAEWHMKDGEKIKPGDIAFTIEGNTQKLLQAERLVLNFMQRMSGIATLTAEYVEKISDLHTKILDTRKTTPGLRHFEKDAVRIGGGQNHRMGLYDMMMIKDNHVDYAGGIAAAIERAHLYQKQNGLDIPIEVEARNLNEVEQILKTGKADRIMLDNFNYEQTRYAVKVIDKQCETESSGGITLETVRPYAECGVDFVSVGALTHQINSLDMSLKAI
ncbi:Nicotinate-nucleotide pyrophosphorylase (carboxylating) [Salinivirga cyanobacteriivorans]|uniref:Probable nicotinate-nucleotide pyrophosphorylase [carboxylating] n=1 Tax=Salinivirga cyanobacteriivorans TaxID=1307839 RepID=A0A0S2I3T9_9BACT|nr:carboxylating nicotinate-nucleotide diphosphorylase [Salinivirga cyanobacteriivorans]ALO17113.1 Nicotinate-nucleotide pyrophosphorylase (carboxylating) [Salinivirga cyanobacteriivorans]